jgi:D-lactate dehydrogenase (cytochrome)
MPSSLSEAQRVVEENERYFAGKSTFMEEHGIVYSVMSMTSENSFPRTCVLLEDEITPAPRQERRRGDGPAVAEPAANPRAREAVVELRRGCQEL